ncbi:N-acetyl-glucosamine-6-phosphate deacetylase [Rhizoclosmatium hyalinum]|nr:N-acetyl-glucosamine-6-phosphate deacetylase [Rhizoclosmatium hyalinum]
MCSNKTIPVADVTSCPNEVVWWGRQYCNQPPCGQLDVRKEKALEVLDQLINEIGSWFSDPVIHVGHDEVNTRAYGLIPDNWDSVPADALHPMMRNFDTRLLGMLGGKTLAAWDEIVTDFGVADIIPKDSLITLWNVPHGAPAAIANVADKGFKNIAVSPSSHWYLDCSPFARWCSSQFERETPASALKIDGYATFTGQWHNWTMIYDYEPLDSLSTNAKSAVKGGFGALWTETVKRHNLDRYVFPRVAAIAERLWSNVKRDEKTAVRLNRFRASLVNEKRIASASLDYLGNKEDYVFRPEYCDGSGLTSPGQKTAECCFPGQPLTAADGSGLIDPYGSHYSPKSGFADYCKIASLYKTNNYKYSKPETVAYEY